MNVQTVTLDVTKPPSTSPVVRLRQGDKNATTIEAAIFDGGIPLALSGKTVKFSMQSPDGQYFYSVDGTVSGNVATFHVDETYAAAVPGITDTAYVEVLEGSTVICSTNHVRVVVLADAEDGADPERAYTSGITEATERANAAAEAAEGTVLQAVPLMSTTVRGGAQLGDGLSIVDGKLTATGETYELPTMSASTKGGAKLGNGLSVVNDTLSLSGESFTSAEKTKLAGIDDGANNYELPTATTSTLGGVKPDGTTVTADANGTIHAQAYSLPTASATVKGGVKVGNGLTMTGEVLSADSYNLPPATTTTLGGVKPDGDTIDVTSDGMISAKQSELYTPDGSTAIVEVDASGDVVVTGGVNITGGTQYSGRTAYPLFVYSTKPTESSLPVTPCFVLVTSDYGLWYYDGN